MWTYMWKRRSEEAGCNGHSAKGRLRERSVREQVPSGERRTPGRSTRLVMGTTKDHDATSVARRQEAR